VITVTDVFVVLRIETNREVIVAVCASRQRAERYVADVEHKHELRIEAIPLLH
jgi:hypothetical protein